MKKTQLVLAVFLTLSLALIFTGCSSKGNSGTNPGSGDTFAITYESGSYGTVTGDTSAKVGARVVVTVAPNEGCKFQSLDIKDEDGIAVSFVSTGTTTYRFTMPDCDVTVRGSFVRIPNNQSLLFEDFKILGSSGEYIATPLNGFGTDSDPNWGDDISLYYGYWCSGGGTAMNDNANTSVHGTSHSIASYVGEVPYEWGRTIRTLNPGVGAVGWGNKVTQQDIDTNSVEAPFDGTGYNGVSFWFKYVDAAALAVAPGAELYFAVMDVDGNAATLDFTPAAVLSWQQFQVDFPDGFDASKIKNYLFGFAEIGINGAPNFFISDMQLIQYD